MKPHVSFTFPRFLTVSVLLWSSASHAADMPAARLVEYVGTPIPIRLSLARPEPVEVQFPEDVVDVVTPLQEQQIGIEFVGPRLYLHAMKALDGGLFAITSSGSYGLTLSTTRMDKHDTVVRIAPAGQHAAARVAATQQLTAVDLVRFMRRKEIPPGVDHATASGREVYNDGTLSLRFVEAYLAPTMRGYVLTAENVADVSVTVPIQNLTMPGLLAAAAEVYTLAPRPHTVEEKLAAAHRCQVYVVLK